MSPQESPNSASASASTAALIARLAAHDADALRDLARTYGQSLGVIALSITGSRELAEDVVQAVLVRVWDERETLSAVRDLTGFLRQLTRHRAIDLVRHEQAHHRMSDRLAADPSAMPAASANTAEAALEADDLRRRVRAALDDVAPRCRDIFLMHWEGGLSYAEIADTLGITRGTVHTQMYRAMRALAERLAPER